MNTFARKAPLSRTTAVMTLSETTGVGDLRVQLVDMIAS